MQKSIRCYLPQSFVCCKGPLVRYDLITEEIEIVGIASFTLKPSFLYPAIFTKVSSYVPWIEESLIEFDRQKKEDVKNLKMKRLFYTILLGILIFQLIVIKLHHSNRGCNHYWFVCLFLCFHERRLSIFQEFFRSDGAYYLEKTKASKAMSSKVKEDAENTKEEFKNETSI